MKTRQNTKSEYLGSSNSVWHLDLILPKQDILSDLKLFASIPDTKSKHSDNNCKIPLEEVYEEQKLNGKMMKKCKEKVLELPVKRRLTTKTENLAVEKISNLCKDLWTKQSFLFKINKKTNTKSRSLGKENSLLAFNTRKCINLDSGVIGFQPSEELIKTYHDFQRRYSKESCKNSYLHGVIAYSMFGYQLNSSS